jgi:hypothetical protein
MAFIDDLLKGESAKGLAIGIGAAILVPVILPAVAALARPVARAAIKTGILVYEKTREAVAEMGEVVEDLVAEARADLEQGQSTQMTAAVAGAVSAADSDSGTSEVTGDSDTTSPA